jgi:hypothetical protein
MYTITFSSYKAGDFSIPTLTHYKYEFYTSY